MHWALHLKALTLKFSEHISSKWFQCFRFGRWNDAKRKLRTLTYRNQKIWYKTLRWWKITESFTASIFCRLLKDKSIQVMASGRSIISFATSSRPLASLMWLLFNLRHLTSYFSPGCLSFWPRGSSVSRSEKQIYVNINDASYWHIIWKEACHPWKAEVNFMHK